MLWTLYRLKISRYNMGYPSRVRLENLTSNTAIIGLQPFTSIKGNKRQVMFCNTTWMMCALSSTCCTKVSCSTSGRDMCQCFIPSAGKKHYRLVRWLPVHIGWHLQNLLCLTLKIPQTWILKHLGPRTTPCLWIMLLASTCSKSN